VAARRSILIFEYLLATPGAWREASASMQREATSMLVSLVSDFSLLPDVWPVVLVATDAWEMLKSHTELPAGTEILSVETGPAEWLASPLRDPESFEATMVIAPECGGILVFLLRQLQTGCWQDVPSLNVRWQLADIFTDKLKTFEWLQKHGLPTPDTKAISVYEHDQLQRRQNCSHLFTHDQSMPENSGLGILKPRDGVGCDGISFIQLSGDEFSPTPRTATCDHSWLLQRYVPGVPCSVGFIGGRGAGAVTVLPPAHQNLKLQNGQPVYYGGRIPCEPAMCNAIAPLAQKLVNALGDFSGYVGVDIVVGKNDTDELQATVIEINPRLCTSYVGYRRTTASNLAARVLGEDRDQEICWKSCSFESVRAQALR
jgi:predicted ATP-grasp superfamily ATP-dependent carboligase